MSSVYHSNVIKIGTIYADIDVEYTRVTSFRFDVVNTFSVSFRDNQYDVGYIRNSEFCYDITREELSSDEVDGILYVLETLAYLHDMVLDNVDGEYAFNVRADDIGSVTNSFLRLHRNGTLRYGTTYVRGCVGEFDEEDYKVSLVVHVDDLFVKVMASRVFDIGKFMRSYVDMVEEYSKGIYSIS